MMYPILHHRSCKMSICFTPGT